VCNADKQTTIHRGVDRSTYRAEIVGDIGEELSTGREGGRSHKKLIRGKKKGELMSRDVQEVLAELEIEGFARGEKTLEKKKTIKRKQPIKCRLVIWEG